jgi:hypothetical protein
MSDKIGSDETMVMKNKLLLSHLNEEHTLYTIDHVETIVLAGKKQRQLVFQEYPNLVHWLNNTQLAILVRHLGDDPDKWSGKQVPILAVDVEYAGEIFRKPSVVEAGAATGWPSDLIRRAWR